MKRYLLGLITLIVALLVLAMILGSAMALSDTVTSSHPLPSESDECFSPQIWENSTKLLEVSERLILTDLAAIGCLLYTSPSPRDA